jgi:DNA-binding NtrC family response regulator
MSRLEMRPPRVLVIDDLFGRVLSGRRNQERENLCGTFLLSDVTGDENISGAALGIVRPVAEAVFFRGQTPLCANVGDSVQNDLESVFKTIRSGWDRCTPEHPRWSLVLLDLCFHTGIVTEESDARTRGMPEARPSDLDPLNYFGLTILQMIHEKFPELPVVILSSMPRQEVSREYTRLGASAFVSRDAENGAELLRELVDHHGLLADDEGEMVGNSLPLLHALRLARKLARSRENLLLRGERGTGKELIARYIHRVTPWGRHPDKAPLVIVNSGALSESLYQSELFGHMKGAFTSADNHRVGSIVQANGGDLFLDEIGNMPLGAQEGILRVLEEQTVQPIGSAQKDFRAVNVRFLSATNADIEAKSGIGKFREDLYDRLRKGGVVVLPALRERKDDIPLLADAFVRREIVKGNGKARSIESDALEALCDYDWPGNIRQFENCIVEAIARNRDAEHLIADHLTIPKGTNVEKRHRSAEPSNVTSRSASTLLGTESRISDLLATVESFPYEKLSAEELAGVYVRVRRACTQLLAGCLRASLVVSKRPTAENPNGVLMIHPALKLLTGDDKLKVPQAYDIVKRVIKFSPDKTDSLLEDPVLNEAYGRSQEGRPASRGKSKPKGSRTDPEQE